MKKTKLFGWAFVATMMSTGFTACSNDAEEVLAQESEIKLTSEITPSRVADLDYQSTQIVKGQQVGVTITGAKSEHNNVAWSVSEDGTLTNTSDAIYFGDGTATITAYHPFNDDWDENTSYAFSVSTDQSTNAEYLASDLLWAKETSQKTETAIPLTFAHKLAKINVTLVPEEDDDDLNGATISIYNTKISTTFNPTIGEISEATGEAQEIIAGVIADDVYTASAIVIPQEVSGKFIKITHEGKTYYYTLASAKTLVAGTSYSYTLTVKGKQLINTGSSINPWNPDSEEGEEGDAEEEVTIPYLTFKADAEQTIKMSKAVATLEYSMNGEDWEELGTTTVTFGGENGDLRLRGKSSIGTAASSEDYATISFGNGVKVSCSGDIRTLIDFENYTTTTTNNTRFCYLFSSNNVLTTAPKLPATNLAECCYLSMFQGCTSLTVAPELPATNLAKHCYCDMFNGSGLITAPKLPATELAYGCYAGMFSQCTNLEKAPELPAISLAENCYYWMFQGCTSLTVAPELPATNLTETCYCGMFAECSSLNSITMLATNINATNCLYFWTRGVSTSGTFIKSSSMVSLPSGADGIPNGWTVENYKE